MAAHRGGIQTVIIPEENERDLVEIPKNIKQNLDIRPVRWIDEVLGIALINLPVPREHVQTVEQPAATGEPEGEKSVESRNSLAGKLTTH